MQTQVVNLKDAQSRIVDTDFAQTMQTLIKGQVIQQAGLALLSVTNMSSDLAMQLLTHDPKKIFWPCSSR